MTNASAVSSAQLKSVSDNKSSGSDRNCCLITSDDGCKKFHDMSSAAAK